ncbi:hypothetical protein [Promineifilum sp.]|uniref:hypothetical protein n=1 Tax=Promineifilum sp. TaxID=2664178 RepID=UPI0035B34556
MSKTPQDSESEDALLPEYQFDYRRAKPNRFAAGDNQRLIVLDPDVAEVFTSSEAVNKVLRALIASMPQAA